MKAFFYTLFMISLSWACVTSGQTNQPFNYDDVFQLEYASGPQISPDGKQIVYARNFMDIMDDRVKSDLWITDFEGADNRPLTTGNPNDYSPRWSPDGKKLLYLSNNNGSTQVYLRWMDTGQTARLTNLIGSPGSLSWSPDGRWIAFTMFVPAKNQALPTMPAKPKGASWAPAAKYIDQLIYRSDGSGFLEPGHTHVFILPVQGGTPRQITSGNYNHSGPISWTNDSKSLLFSSNRNKDWELEPLNSEIYQVSIATGEIKALTGRKGPDRYPLVSPSGKQIAYLGFDDRYQGYQVTKLYVMNADGTNARLLTGSLDRDIEAPRWSADGKSIYFLYDDQGNTKLASISMSGKLQQLTANVGGLSLGRPYSGGAFSLADNGSFAFTQTTPYHPADVAVGDKSGKVKTLTNLNDDLFGFKQLGKVEEIKYPSSHDQREIQGWYITPPGFDPSKKYPLILEIHGGPFANYGDRFSTEMQLYAAAGYVVLYINPRGSTGYGGEFGNLIHHNYPGEDYDDLMSGVDEMIKKGFIDDRKLYVTGGSGGGVLTAWIVGKTNRFKAAVVAKPVINWYSFVLTSDGYNFFYKYWFPGLPWDHSEHYLKRSPISLVKNVTTPTMLLTGEVDYRTPMSETEQYYQALKLLKVESAMVRIPGASHGIARRPSNLITKVAYILKWFKEH